MQKETKTCKKIYTQQNNGLLIKDMESKKTGGGNDVYVCNIKSILFLCALHVSIIFPRYLGNIYE